ncbi:MAG: hypothetical protein OEM38_04195 [Gammaproteobacteria bacterium]|nr:hypothetical protein [Gammaproteobacteria bacterium]
MSAANSGIPLLNEAPYTPLTLFMDGTPMALFFVVDDSSSDGLVLYSDNNNTAGIVSVQDPFSNISATTTPTTAGIDLKITFDSVVETSGTSADVTYTVTNTGDTDATAFNVMAWADSSAAPGLTSTGGTLATRHTALAAGASASATIAVSGTWAAGSYNAYLIADFSSEVTETDEGLTGTNDNLAHLAWTVAAPAGITLSSTLASPTAITLNTPMAVTMLNGTSGYIDIPDVVGDATLGYGVYVSGANPSIDIGYNSGGSWIGGIVGSSVDAISSEAAVQGSAADRLAKLSNSSGADQTFTVTVKQGVMGGAYGVKTAVTVATPTTIASSYNASAFGPFTVGAGGNLNIDIANLTNGVNVTLYDSLGNGVTGGSYPGVTTDRVKAIAHTGLSVGDAMYFLVQPSTGASYAVGDMTVTTN